MNNHYTQPLRIEELARVANLGNSTLHHRFKAVTAMSPLQYQKQLRLQEARRLLLGEGLDVASACYRVGYESPRNSAGSTVVSSGVRHQEMPAGCATLRERLTGGEWVASS